MIYLPTSFMIFFFFFFFLYHPLPCASGKQEHEFCDALQFECGNITAGFPFWGGHRPQICGHPSLELQCKYKTNYTSLTIFYQVFQVLHLDQKTNTLRLSKAYFPGLFCPHFLNTRAFPLQIFELSPTSKSLAVFYHCEPSHRNLSSHKAQNCSDIGPISVSKNLEHHKTCHDNFTVNVPSSFDPDEKKLDMADLESVVKKGFEVKVKIDENACEECLSSHEFCGFNQSLPSQVQCIPLNPAHKDAHLSHTREEIHSKGLSTREKTGIEISSGLVVVLILIGGSLLCVISCLSKRSDDLFQKNLRALIPLKQYSYAQVKRITKSFTEVIGKGGFGTVYRGTLCDGRIVAVKILKDSMGNGEDFINEVASMSKTSHVNIVSLLGFCSEGSNRAIIYEYLENGSLAQFISSKTSMNMDWKALYGIALGVARGLEYLHHGCETRIVHFDIKPHNVLLDDNLCPKVSDFGLAKLCEKKESILSLLDTRGTIGYIAPELFSRMYGRVSHKSDVYSFGMLVFEMIGARNKERAHENSASDTSSMYFPEWVYRDLELGNSRRLMEIGISKEEEEIAKKLTLVGLWCIQSSPSDRPSMKRVVEMMEGRLDALEVPPRPVLQQIPPTILQESSWVSEETSIPFEV